jgi:hypothetical protein
MLKKLKAISLILLLICIPTPKAKAFPSVPFPKITLGISLSVLVGSILTNIIANKAEKACMELSLIIYFLRNAKTEDVLLAQLNSLPENLMCLVTSSLSTNDGNGGRAMTNKEIAKILSNLSDNPNFKLEEWLTRDEHVSKILAYASLVTAAISSIAAGLALKSISST